MSPQSTSHKSFLIVALDFYQQKEAQDLVARLGEDVSFYKVGMQLFYSAGLSILEYLHKQKKKIFLDLKINDIPNTVEKAVGAFKNFSNIEYMTVFTDEAGVGAAVKGAQGSAIKILNVTVLTSQKNDADQVRTQVGQRAQLTLAAGGQGIICSGQETAFIRKELGHELVIVNPGIRPPGFASQDQARVVTPRMAYDSGATNIVVGRPITQAEDASSVAKSILASLR